MAGREVALAVVLVVAALSGCLVQSRYEASPAAVADDALSETGYEQTANETISQTRTDAGPNDENVTVVSYARAYAREVSVAGRERPLAAVGVLSTPSVRVAGEQFNPVADEPFPELFERFRPRLTEALEGRSLGELTAAGSRSLTVLETDTTVRTFETTVETDAGPVATTVEVVRVQHGSDYVVVVALYPSGRAGEERPRVDRLLAGLEHDA